MFKRSMKKVAMLFTVLSLGSVVVPGIVSSSIYAASVEKVETNKKITPEEFDKFVNEGVRKYGLSYEEAEYLLNRVLGDQLTFKYYPSRAQFFTDKGITVEGMAFAINAVFTFILGSGFSSVLKEAYIKGNWTLIQAATRRAKMELINKGFAPIANLIPWFSGTLSFLIDPGYYLANWWDSQDAYPYNGHINF